MQCGTEKNVHSVDLGWSVLYMHMRSAWSSSEFKSWIFLLIFCLIDMSNIDSGVLKWPTITVWESKSLCKSLRTCLIYLGAPYWVHIYLESLALLVVLILLALCNVLPCLF